MELIWLDGDICESWDDLLEHLWMTGEAEQPNAFDVIYKGVRYTKDQLIENLKPLVELNAQLYDAWGLLYKVKRGENPINEINVYLANPIGWKEKPDA